MHGEDYRDDPAERMRRVPTVRHLLEELASGLSRYWAVAGSILVPCGVSLQPPGKHAFSLSRNLFSLLFLYSYLRMGIPRHRRILYAAALQCMRGMVTGCDNLLDDEYKPTLETDLPATGYRFRSVVDIMVSDRVLFQLLTDAAREEGLSADRVMAATTASMHTMTRSGIQEAAEEAGVDAILAPEAILETVHHFKTGMLFQCPWDIPRTIEQIAESELAPLLEGLYDIGMGCQVLDDVVDIGADIQKKRHNYLIALVHHGQDAQEKAALNRFMSPATQAALPAATARHFPQALRKAWDTACRSLVRGLKALFAPADQGLVDPAMQLLVSRIGANAPDPEQSA